MWLLGSIVVLIGVAFLAFILSLIRQSGNEFYDGAEIPEDELAGALEGDLRTFVADENARHCTRRIPNYAGSWSKGQ